MDIWNINKRKTKKLKGGGKDRKTKTIEMFKSEWYRNENNEKER